MYFIAAQDDRSDALTLAQQRHAQQSAMAQVACSRLRFRKFVAFGGLHVVHMYRFPVEDRAPDQPFVRVYRYRAVMRASMKVVTILQAHDRIICIAELAG